MTRIHEKNIISNIPTSTDLWSIGRESIRSLECDHGILASSKQEMFGCVFGRDSLISSLSLLSVYERTRDPELLALVRKVLENLAHLQGTQINIESGEEPGKCIHEYRLENHSHLTADHPTPWYVYPDGSMRSFDTVDATPLFLMTMHRYYAISGDVAFIESLLPKIRLALQWILIYGDSNGDGFIDYGFHPDRAFGGLRVQSWMDSEESVFFEKSDERPVYPIAPIEAQAYAYVALQAWGDFFSASDSEFSDTLRMFGDTIKENFNKKFVLKRNGKIAFAFALDGLARPLSSTRSSIGHVLWATWKIDGKPVSIIDEAYIPALAGRLLARDMFVPRAGIRTLSSRSKHFDPRSYHNGSIWPHDTAITAEGLRNFGYHEEADRVRDSLLYTYTHFKTPIELFVYARGKHRNYTHADGRNGCQVQAWSAAALLSQLA